MKYSTLVIIAMLAACVSCQSKKSSNAATTPAADSVKTEQKAAVTDSFPDIAGVYSLPENSCDITITFIKEADGYRYFIKGEHLDVEGNAVLSREENEIYITFDGPTGGESQPNSVSGLYANNTLTIQNSGNAQNQYTVFEECQDKYLVFTKR